MASRSSNIPKVQALNRSEHTASKIPNAVPLKKILPEGETSADPLEPTPKMNIKRPPKRRQDAIEGSSSSLERTKRSAQKYLGGNDDVDHSRCNEIITAQAREIEMLRNEINRLQEEREMLARQFEQRGGVQGQGSMGYEWERQVQWLQGENKRLEEMLNQTRIEKTTVENQFAEFRMYAQGNDAGRMQGQYGGGQSLDAMRTEWERQIMWLQNENKRLEENLNQVRSEKTTMENQMRYGQGNAANSLQGQQYGNYDLNSRLLEYEQKISTLQSEVNHLRSTGGSLNGDWSRQSAGIAGITGTAGAGGVGGNVSMEKLREENAYLLEEIRLLQNRRREMEAQVDRMRAERYGSDDLMRQKLVDAARVQNENNDIQRVLLMTEIERLKNELAEKSLRGYEYSDIQGDSRKRVALSAVEDGYRGSGDKGRIADYEKRIVLFMIEIERLGQVVAELQSENEVWRQQVVESEEISSSQMAEFKRQYEQIIRPQIELQIRNATGTLEADKKALEVENRGYKLKIEEYERNAAYLRSEIAALQQKNGELLRQGDEWRLKYSQTERGGDSMKYTVESDLRLRLEREKTEWTAQWIQERGRYEDEIRQYKQRLSEMEGKMIMLPSEVEHLNFVIKSKDEEIQVLKRMLVEAEQMQKRQLEQSREVLETGYKSRLETETMARSQQAELKKSSVDRDIKQHQDRANELEGQLQRLNQEYLRLKQEDDEKTRVLIELKERLVMWDDREKELAAWKMRYNQLLESHNQETERMRIHYEESFQARLENEVKQVQNRNAGNVPVGGNNSGLEAQLRDALREKEELENKLILLGTEMERLTKELDERTRERDEMARRGQEVFNELERMRAGVEGEMSRMGAQQVEGFKMMSVLYMAEIERLHMIIYEKEKEGDTLMQAINEMEEENMKKLQDMKTQFEEVLRTRLTDEVKQVGSQWQEERKVMENEINNWKLRNKELQDMAARQNEEAGNLRNQLGEKDKEMQGLRQKVNQGNVDQGKQAAEIRANVEANFTAEFEKQVRELNNRFHSDRAALEEQIRQLMNRNRELEDQMRQDKPQSSQTTTKESEVMIRRFQEEKAGMEGYIGQLTQRISELENQLRQDKPQSSQTTKEFELVIRQFEQGMAEKDREAQGLRERLGQLENQLRLTQEQAGHRDKEAAKKNSPVRPQDDEEKRMLQREVEMLRQKLDEAQRNLGMLSGELEKHAKLNLDLKNQLIQAENQVMSMKTSTMGRPSVADVENSKKEIVIQYESQIKELTGRFSNERAALEDQVRQLRNRISEMEYQLRQAEDKGIQSNARASTSTQEFEIVIRQYQQEKAGMEGYIGQLTQRISELESQLRRSQTSSPIKVEHEIAVQNVHSSPKEQGKRSAMPQAQPHQNKEIEILLQKNEEYQRNLALLSTELERQAQLNLDMKSQLDQAKAQVITLQANTTKVNQVEVANYKTEEYQRNMTLLSAELERQAQLNLDLKNQLDQAKAQAISLQAANLGRVGQVELDQLRIQLESQYRNERENMLKELHGRFSVEIQNYENQIRELRQKIIDNETQGYLFNDETKRLNAMIADKNNEIEVWKGKLVTFEKVKEQQIQEIVQKHELERRASVDKELGGIAGQFSSERAQYELKLHELRQKIDEYENKFIYLTVENDRLRAQFEEKFREVESWKTRYTNLEHANFSDFEEVRVQIDNLKRSSLTLNDFEVRFQAERTTYEAQILQYKHKISELEAMYTDLTKENQRLSTIYFQKNAEAETLKRKSSTEAISQEEFSKLQKENEELKKLIAENHELKIRSEVDRSNYQSHLAQLKQIIEANQIEMSKLGDLLEVRKAENQALYRDLDKMREETNKKLKNYKELEAEYAMLSSRYKNINQEIEDLQHARDTYKSQLEKNEVELAQKNRELLQKIHQIDALKDKYEQAIANVDPIASTIITRISTGTREATKSIWQA